MLSIILPGINQRLIVRLSDEYEGSYKEAFKNGFKPILEFEDLRSLGGKPVLSDLLHYIVSGTCLLDTRDIAYFSLGVHCQLRNLLLNSNIPSLGQDQTRKVSLTSQFANRLYQHNQYFRVLHEDMDFYENKGITPKKALEQLIQGLQLGGERMTGSEMATSSATIAFSRFLEYFESLPVKTQVNLKVCKGQKYDLEHVIEEELKKGQCVETAALHLLQILESCDKIPLWNNSVVTNPESIKMLQNKYKSCDGLLTSKEESTSYFLPERFIIEAIRSITTLYLSDVMFYILNLPEQWYIYFLKHLAKTRPIFTLKSIVYCLEKPLLSSEQKQALCKTLLPLYQLAYPKASFIDLINWSIESKVEACFIEAIYYVPDEQIISVVSSLDNHGNTILHKLVERPNLLQYLFRRLTIKQRMEAIRIKDKFGDSVLYDALIEPKSLEILLKLLPKGQLLEELTVKDRCGNPLLHRSSQSLKVILEFLPEIHRLDALMVVNIYDQTVLALAASNSDLMKIILSNLSVEQYLIAVRVKDTKGRTMLCNAAGCPFLFKMLLKHIPIDQRLEALKTLDNLGYTILHHAAFNLQNLKTLFELLPKNQGLDAMKTVSKNGTPVIKFVATTDSNLQFIIKNLPVEHRIEAIMILENTVSISKVANELVQMIIDDLSLQDWSKFLEAYDFIQQPDGIMKLKVSIECLRLYGMEILPSTQGLIAKTLADVMDSRVDDLILKSIYGITQSQDLSNLYKEFIYLANSQNAAMKDHRAVWKPMVANVLIAVSEVTGLKTTKQTSAHSIDNQRLSVKSCMFFAKEIFIGMKEEAKRFFTI